MENYEQESNPLTVADVVAEAFTQHVEAFVLSGAPDDQDDLDEFWDNVPI